MKHIGIIAVSAEGAALCFAHIARQGAIATGRDWAHPRISMDCIPMSEHMHAISENDWDGVGDLMADSATRLVQAGCEILVCPDNTVHQAGEHFESQLTVPFIHIARNVASMAQQRGYSRIGLLGTKYLMTGPVYRDAFAHSTVELVVPETAEREETNRIIFEELVYNRCEARSLQRLVDQICWLQRQQCQAVILGCTELPIWLSEQNSPLPVLDSTRLLAEAALQASLHSST